MWNQIRTLEDQSFAVTAGGFLVDWVASGMLHYPAAHIHFSSRERSLGQAFQPWNSLEPTFQG
jgi:hypothetical protein